MRKTNTQPTNERIAVDIDTLQTMLSIGRNNAYRIAEDAGAVITIGRRKLFNVKKVQAYMDSISEGGREGDLA